MFNRPFKRKRITDDKYLLKLVHYIHYNPVEHGFCEKPKNWKYLSYSALISRYDTLIAKAEVLEWFGDIENLEGLEYQEQKIRRSGIIQEQL